MSLAMMLSGFLFLLIIVLVFSSERFGYVTMNDLDPEAKLQEISRNPGAFKTGFALILTEHASIVALAIALLVAFGSYNAMLAVVWTVCRIGEGSVQAYYKRDYWGLLRIAGQYPGTRGAERQSLTDLARGILSTKDRVFSRAQILFSIGTLAYCVLFAVYEVVPAPIGWFGIVSSTLYGFGNGIRLARPDVKGLWGLGGVLVLFFEIVLGGWLVFDSIAPGLLTL